MGKKSATIFERVKLEKLVHGGQCIAKSTEGKTVFAWGGLSGELVDIKITKKKSSYIEGIVTEIHESSADRIEPKEPLSYLSTSPWQIMTFKSENREKQKILAESFRREQVEIPNWAEFYSGDAQYGYRNKMELGFWGDDDGLHLAHYVRGTHGRQKVQGSALAMDCINNALVAVRDELRRLDIWAGDLKTVLIRANQQKEVVGALFIKKEPDAVSMGDFKLPKELKGLDIYYSDPKSPASKPTKKLYSLGDITLADSVCGINITYDVLSFFQVNLPVFEQALSKIKAHLNGHSSIDFYSGVGTIGVAVGSKLLVESEEANIALAKINSKTSNTKVVHASSENALKHIAEDKILIVDPPRAGLHRDVVDHINNIKPLKVVYLSCNPSTQARDVKLLEDNYKVTFAQGFNFFPRTPHIESLLVLELK